MIENSISGIKVKWQEIAKLTEQNRQSRSPKIERKLIALREAIALAYPEKSNNPTPVERFKIDIFEGTKGLPEINAQDLTADALASGVLFHGGLLVRGLYNKAQIRRLSQAAYREQELKIKDPKSVISPFTFTKLMDVYEECGLLDVVKAYLGDDAIISLERARLRLRTADKIGGLAWHQDANYFGESCFALNCWAAVSACGITNPGLSIIPKRNHDRIGWDKEGKPPLDYGDGMKPLVAAIITEHSVVRPKFNPGDALLFDEMTLHRTFSPPELTDDQIVSISWFFSRSRLPVYKTPLAF